MGTLYEPAAGVSEASVSPLEARVLVVSDIFDALPAQRPYREALPLERVFEIMHQDAPHALDAVCLEALEQSGAGCNQTFTDLQTLQKMLGQTDLLSRPVPRTAETLVLQYADGGHPKRRLSATKSTSAVTIV